MRQEAVDRAVNRAVRVGERLGPAAVVAVYVLEAGLEEMRRRSRRVDRSTVGGRVLLLRRGVPRPVVGEFLGLARRLPKADPVGLLLRIVAGAAFRLRHPVGSL